MTAAWKYVLSSALCALLLCPEWAAAQDEGIAVHGRWTIEVLNADGSLASRTEFENALASNAQQELLGPLFAEGASIDSWRVMLQNGCGFFANGEWLAGACRIDEGDGTSGSGLYWNTLTVNKSPSGTILLSGWARLENVAQAEIRSVQTAIRLVGTSQYFWLTSKGLTGSYVTLTEGQMVQVSVEISFS